MKKKLSTFLLNLFYHRSYKFLLHTSTSLSESREKRNETCDTHSQLAIINKWPSEDILFCLSDGYLSVTLSLYPPPRCFSSENLFTSWAFIQNKSVRLWAKQFILLLIPIVLLFCSATFLWKKNKIKSAPIEAWKCNLPIFPPRNLWQADQQTDGQNSL